MQVRWSPKAAANLSSIVSHIRKDNREAALNTAREIYERAGALSRFPNRGRIGRVEGIRELPLPPLPFVLVYRVHAYAVAISNILHGAQDWK